MDNEVAEQWKKKAARGDWQSLLEDTLNQYRIDNLTTVIWRVRALRALARGDEANKELQQATTGEVKSDLKTFSEVAEELIQCAMFKHASPLVNALLQAKHPAGHFLNAAVFREQSKYHEALKALESLKFFGEDWQKLAQISEAWIRLRQGWLCQAEECLKPYLSDISLSTQKLIARFEIASGQIAAAQNRLNAIALRQPLDWEWPHLLATVNAMRGDNLVACLELIDQGLSRQPRQAEAYALISTINLSMGNQKAAEEAMLKAMLIKPWNDGALIPLISYLANKKDFKGAETLLGQARKLANTPQRQAIELDLMRLERKRKRDVTKKAEKLANNYQDDPHVLRSCAAALIATGRRDAAARLLERILLLNSFDKAAKNNLAVLYKERGDMDDAIALWRELAVEGERAAKINLANAFVLNSNYLEAQDTWDEIETNCLADRSTIESGRAELTYRRGELNVALSHIKIACQLEPKKSENWLKMARIEGILNGAKKAVEILETVENSVDYPLTIRSELVLQWKRLLVPSEILRRIKGWQQDNPNDYEYFLMEATIASDAVDFNRAEHALREAVKRDDSVGMVELIRFTMERGKFESALQMAQKWKKEDPCDIKRLAQLSEVYFFDNKPERALEITEEALKINPNRASLVRQQVGILLNLKRYKDAENCAKKLWDHSKEYLALQLWLRTIERTGDYQRSLKTIKELLEKNPADEMLRARLAQSLIFTGDLQNGTEVMIDLCKDTPNNENNVKSLVQCLMKLHRKDEALETIKRFSARQSNRIDIQIAIATIALEQGLIDEARTLLANLQIKASNMIEVWINAAMVERRALRIEEEKDIWRKLARQFHPSRWIHIALDHWLRLGMETELEEFLNIWRSEESNNPRPWRLGYQAAFKLKRYTVASNLIDGIEKRIGRTTEILSSRANLASEQWKMSDAIRFIQEACDLAPINTNLLEQKINLNVKSGNWSSFDSDFSKLCYLLADKQYENYARFFFNINCHPSWDTKKIFGLYQEWAEHTIRPRMFESRGFENKLDPDRKLRIGYLSPDFRGHAVAKFSLPIVTSHHKADYEVFAYAHLENGSSDEWTNQFKNKVDHWREIQYWSNDELENAIRKDQIDILVDLAGHTSNNSLNIFVNRVAPIQASHIIGAGQTTGMPCVDYLIASEALWPQEDTIYASERVERLPYSGLVFHRPDDMHPPKELPCVSSDQVVFGVFARPLRVSESNIRVWSEILKKTPKSILRFEHSPYLEIDIQDRYRLAFEQMGIGPERIQFCNTRPYWQAFQAIDIQLDPFPTGSGTTATEGLYMGRLVIAKCGRPAMGRVAHAQLSALQLGEWCSANSENEYISKAVTLANDKKLLIELSKDLQDRFLKSSIMDYSGYVKLLESAYRKWWHEYCDKNSS